MYGKCDQDDPQMTAKPLARLALLSLSSLVCLDTLVIIAVLYATEVLAPLLRRFHG